MNLGWSPDFQYKVLEWNVFEYKSEIHHLRTAYLYFYSISSHWLVQCPYVLRSNACNRFCAYDRALRQELDFLSAVIQHRQKRRADPFAPSLVVLMKFTRCVLIEESFLWDQVATPMLTPPPFSSGLGTGNSGLRSLRSQTKDYKVRSFYYW